MATATKTPNTTQAVDTAEDVVSQLQNGGQSAIGAVRRFLDKVDENLAGDRAPSVPHELADSALEMSDKMVEYGGDALRGIVRSARDVRSV
jgi:hypothetical protein